MFDAVTEPTMILDSPEDTIADIGDSQTFTCIATGVPLPTITWSKDGSPLDPGVNITVTTNGTQSITSMLVFNSFLLSDAGQYSCNASNEVSGSDVREFNLTLEGKRKTVWSASVANVMSLRWRGHFGVS